MNCKLPYYRYFVEIVRTVVFITVSVFITVCATFEITYNATR